jgi:HK97 family phage portal protein
VLISAPGEFVLGEPTLNEILRAKGSRSYAPIGESVAAPSGVPPFYGTAQTASLQQTVQVSVWVFAAVYRLAATLAATDLKIVRRGTKDVEVRGGAATKVLDVIERVNDEDTQFDFLEASFIYLNLNGENYIEKSRDGFGATRELHHLNPEIVFPIPDRSGSKRVRGYSMRVGGQSIEIPASEVIPTRVFNPSTPYRGTSPVAPVRREVASDVQAALYNLSLLQQGARTGGVLSPEPGTYFSEERFKRLVAGVREQTSGSSNAGRMLVLPDGLTFVPDTQSLKDMDFLNLRKFGRECVAAAIGVPPMLINDFDSATYANSEQQLKAFWDYVGKPWLKKLYGSLNEHWVHKDVSRDIKIVPDIIGIDAMVDSEESRVTTTSTLFQAGVITQNEARQRMGYGPVDGGDMFMLPLNLDPAESAEERRGREDEAAEEPDPAPVPPVSQDADAPDDDEGDDEKRVRLPARVKEAILTDDARKILSEAHLKALDQNERRVAGLTEGFLASQRSRAIERLRDEGLERMLTSFDVEQEAKAAFAALGPEIARILKESGEEQLRRLGRFDVRGGRWRIRKDLEPDVADLVVSWDLGNPRLAEFLEKDFFGHLVDLNGTTLKELRDSMRLGVSLGEGTSELYARIEEMPTFSADRAERIARTETIGAVNKGTLESFVANGTPLKSWLSIRDGDRVREAHQVLDAETSDAPIAARDMFRCFDPVRGEQTELEYPGDQRAAAWATVNCRCALRPREDFALSIYTDSVLRGGRNGKRQEAR